MSPPARASGLVRVQLCVVNPGEAIAYTRYSDPATKSTPHAALFVAVVTTTVEASPPFQQSITSKVTATESSAGSIRVTLPENTAVLAASAALTGTGAAQSQA